MDLEEGVRHLVTGRGWSAEVTCEACPVQLEGRLDSGPALYWRSRHRGWQFGIDPHGEPDKMTFGDHTREAGQFGVQGVVADTDHPYALGGENLDQVRELIDHLIAAYNLGLQLPFP